MMINNKNATKNLFNMNFNNYLKGFNSFNDSHRINEMASELTKLGVPKDLMQFIHKLSGKLHKMVGRGGDRQIDPGTGRTSDTFSTRKEPYKAKGGPWPEREDIPLSHDVAVNGTKSGKRNIYHYLTQLLDSRRDSGLRLILVNPNIDQVQYITRKTGKMSKEQLADAGISDTEEARSKGISQKRGLYMRVVALDGDSGTPISAWEGTIGQMAEDWDDDTVLYIMENEDRVRTKRTARTERTKVTSDSFIKYFMDNLENIASGFISKKGAKAEAKYREEYAKLDPVSDFEGGVIADTEQGRKVRRLMADLKKESFDPESFKPKLNNFQELAFKEGEYNPHDDSYSGRDKASLSDMVNIHTMPVVASMFLQYLVLGKVYKKFYTDDPFKELGVDDLLFDV